MNKAAQAYLQTQVTTTTQGELLIMLYDAALKFLKQAKERMAARDYAGKGILISKALDIVSELSSSLNLVKGGDLAVNLSKLYFICSTRLLEANLRLDQSKIDEVVNILTGLRNAFAQINGKPLLPTQTADSANEATTPAAFPSTNATALPDLPQPGQAIPREQAAPSEPPTSSEPASPMEQASPMELARMRKILSYGVR